MAGLLPDRIRRAPCSGREGQGKRGSRGQSCLNNVQRWRKGSCVYDLSTSFQRGKERTIPRVFPSSVRPTDKPSFFCNFRARSPGNPWKIRDPTETVLLSRRVTTRVSGFVVLLSLLQRLTARRSPRVVLPWTRTKLRPCNLPLWKIGRNFGRIYPTCTSPLLPFLPNRDPQTRCSYIAIIFHALERQPRDRSFFSFFSFSNGFSLKVF